MLWSLFLCVIVYSSLVCSVIQSVPEVQLQNGKARGKLKTLASGEVVRMYLGIPYAKAKRFELPGPPDSWNGTKDATSFGDVCWQDLQNSSISGTPRANEMSEDCLNLNVYVPHKSKTNLAVMVWIHGGSNLDGSNRAVDGSHLATIGNVIVVTINYRLGLFGFGVFNGNDAGPNSNYGTYDQIEALKWLKNNIASFGGNPKKVTLFGSSSGSKSVSLLCISPLAARLFDNAIMQSGVLQSPWFQNIYSSTIKNVRDFSKSVGCTDPSHLKTCLKTVPAKKLTTYLHPMTPVIDGKILLDDPIEVIKCGRFQKRNILIGVTDDDGSLYTNAIPELSKGIDIVKAGNAKHWNNLIAMPFFRQYFPVAKQESTLAAALYRYTYWPNVTDPYRSRRMFVDFLTDYMMTAPSIKFANEYSKIAMHSIKMYFYELQYAIKQGVASSLFKVPSLIKTYHQADKFILFGYALNDASKLYTKDANFSRTMIKMWTNFAKTGNPNNPGTNTWPQYKLRSQQYLALKPDMEAKSRLRANHMAFWNDYLPKLKNSLKCPERNTTLSNDDNVPKHSKSSVSNFPWV